MFSRTVAGITTCSCRALKLPSASFLLKDLIPRSNYGSSAVANTQYTVLLDLLHFSIHRSTCVAHSQGGWRQSLWELWMARLAYSPLWCTFLLGEALPYEYLAEGKSAPRGSNC